MTVICVAATDCIVHSCFQSVCFMLKMSYFQDIRIYYTLICVRTRYIFPEQKYIYMYMYMYVAVHADDDHQQNCNHDDDDES